MNNIKNNIAIVDVYKNFATNLGPQNIMNILQDIKSEKYGSEINSIRYALHKEDKDTADALKEQLLAFTASGTFGEKRKAEYITSYSQLLCLDFDDIPLPELQNIIDIINNCKHTFASFISPSGEGVKVIVKVDANAEAHTEAYIQVATAYSQLANFPYDVKCKDISRLCFVSSDCDTYINENADTFHVDIVPKVKELPKEPRPITTENKQLPIDQLLDRCLNFTEQKEQYYEGNRNNFIYLFSSNACKFGIEEQDAYDFCTTNFDLKTKEIKNAVRSAYKSNNADFAKFAKFANNVNEKEFQDQEKQSIDNLSLLVSTPIIPKKVYDRLPALLKKGSEVIKSERERDVFLTGALSIISGCLPNVSGTYSGKVVYPNLFSFLLAPAASGKGSLTFSKTLAEKYHKAVIAESKQGADDYKQELEEVKHAKKYLKKDEEQPKTPEEPAFKVVFIPANTSNAKIIKHLEDNDGFGIICETEADTLGQIFKNDWGSYSDLLRKAYHHESISISRKTNNEYFEIEKPRLSVVLSGTPNQILNIIQSAEDGLFSRFMFYVFASPPVWLDPSPMANPINLTEYFNGLSEHTYNMVKYLENTETEIHLSEEQWKKFNPLFDEYLFRIYNLVSQDATSVVKRLGQIVYRFAMIFTAMRKYEFQMHDTVLECSDDDFDNALILADIYLQHSLLVYKNLPSQGDNMTFKPTSPKANFYKSLPQEFERKEAVKIGQDIKISERTVDNYLLKLEKAGFLSKPKTGYYVKLK